MRYAQIVEAVRQSVALDEPGAEGMGSWFHGPVGENERLFKRLVHLAIADHSAVRRSAYPFDPPWVDTTTRTYRRGAAAIERQLQALIRRLSRYSIPWSSYRYHAHMNWDISLPAMVGYIAAMMYNQNNVAGEGSPVTTALEIEVAKDLCRMIGFGGEGEPEPWGHLTCGGTIANAEAMWAMRNTKLFPFAVRNALIARNGPEDAFAVEVTGGGGATEPLVKLTNWQILNLTPGVTFQLVNRLRDEHHWTQAELASIDDYSVQHLGLGRLSRRFEAELGDGRMVDDLAFLSTATRHYSMPKASTLLGLGTGNLLSVPIDRYARMDLHRLEEILIELADAQRPVAGVIAVLGSTQEGSVDPLDGIIALREELRENHGMDFWIHADAAWGGYFASLLRTPHRRSGAAGTLRAAQAEAKRLAKNDLMEAVTVAYAQVAEHPAGGADAATHPEEFVFTPEMTLSDYVAQQLEAMHRVDSVTLDPHKSGFAPYPAGALCYRDHYAPEMVQYTAPIVHHDGLAPTVGTFGIEGSKPGAAAAAVWLSHRVIRPDQSGYGRVLGRSIFNSKRLIGAIATLRSPHFIVRTLQPLKSGELDLLETLNSLTNRELWRHLNAHPRTAALFRDFGSDLGINAYAVNFVLQNGRLNHNPALANQLNDRVFRRLSLEHEGDEWPGMFITASEYDPNLVGPWFVENFRQRLGLMNSVEPMKFLLCTSVNPWLTDADGGASNMIPVLVSQFRTAVEEEVLKIL